MTIPTFLDAVLSTPQESAMLIGGGIAAVLHYACGMFSGKRCEPGKLLLFVGSAAGMIAGVYVFFEALKATFSQSAITLSHQNAVWAGIGGACVALFTFDLLVTELRMLAQKPERPVTPIVMRPDDHTSYKDAPSPKSTTRES
jgi:uncharacterized membrane protein